MLERFGFLLVLFFLFVARSLGMALNLRRLRKLHKQGESESSLSSDLRTSCFSRAQGFKDIALLTFFLSVLHWAWYTADLLMPLEIERPAMPLYVVSWVGNSLVYLCAGMIACTAFHTVGMLSTSALRKR